MRRHTLILPSAYVQFRCAIQKPNAIKPDIDGSAEVTLTVSAKAKDDILKLWKEFCMQELICTIVRAPQENASALREIEPLPEPGQETA